MTSGFDDTVRARLPWRREILNTESKFDGWIKRALPEANRAEPKVTLRLFA